MKGGDVVLLPLPQADGQLKNRPALVLCRVRPFDDLLLCGLSTQFRQQVPDFDEPLLPADADYATSGLAAPSLIRLGFLATVPSSAIKGRIGVVAAARHDRLLKRLADYLGEQRIR